MSSLRLGVLFVLLCLTLPGQFRSTREGFHNNFRAETLQTTASREPATHRLDFSSEVHIVPVMVNNPGQFGAFFKTRVSILDVATNNVPLNYAVKATLYNQFGKVKDATFTLANGQQLSWDNFLEDVFQYQGAGAVKLDSSTEAFGVDQSFLFSAEVYTDSPSGQFKTSVRTNKAIDTTFSAFSPGIFVDANSRTNIGCFNNGSGVTQVRAELRRGDGSLVNTYTLNLAQDGWNQVGITDSVTGGYIRWRPASSAYCYAVVVDNTSNDGTFIPAQEHLN